jgi:outer membrane receptor protein involved in Fe transport
MEFGVPLLDDKDFGKIDADLAGRATGYSTSGFVATWKTGLTWQTPLDGVKFRTVMSRDVRAPNLSELYAAPVSLRATITNDATGAPITLNQINIGNLNLLPEKSSTKELGIVFQPSWLSGFRASVDYWRVDVKNEIGNLNAQQEEDTCFASGGASPVCAAIQLTGISPSITVQAFNLASAVTDGFDIEASQQFDLENWGVPGDFSLRAIMTHVSKFITNPGVANQAVTETAGNNTGSTPLWRGITTEGWTNDVWGVNLTERWFSDGVFNKNFITCTSGCPATTIQHPTVNFNKMDGAFYLDVGVTYKASEKLELYTKIDNLANADPLPAPVGASANGANASLYDVIGRMFHAGLRYSY